MKHLVFCVIVAITCHITQTALAATCANEATIAQLIEAGQKGEDAFAAMDLTELLKEATRAREDILPCVKKPLSPKQAAAFHRLMALEAFTRHNDQRVKAEFHAARRLEPGYMFPPELASEDHPLFTSYKEAARASDGAAEAIYAPENGYVVASGVRGAPRMSKTPVIIQVYGRGKRSQEAWVETLYVQPGQKLPVWGKNVFGVTAKDLGIDTEPTWQKPEPWFILAGVSAAIATTFYALAKNERSQFDDPTTSDGNLKNHRDRANGFGYTAIATGGLALVLSGFGVVFHIGFGEEGQPRDVFFSIGGSHD